MQTLAASQTSRKPLKAFYATVYDASGVLAKVNGQISLLRYDDGAITDYEPEMAPWPCILGEVGPSDTQVLMDRLHGGAARIACSRLQEVA